MTTDQVELQVVRDVVRQELAAFFGARFRTVVLVLLVLIALFMGCMASYWALITFASAVIG